MKKMMTVLFAMVLLCGCLSMGAVSVSAEKYDTLTYEIVEGEAIITDCYHRETAVMIPSTLGGYPVTAIKDWGFSGCSKLAHVNIMHGVTTIGRLAFQLCESLETVIIPTSVTTIGDDAFEDCTSLTTVYYAGNESDRAAISIGEGNAPLLNATWHYNPSPKGAASGTTGDCTWTLDDDGNLTISGNGAMGNYSNTVWGGYYRTAAPWGWEIISVTIEEGVTTIGDYTFAGCTSLRSVTMGDSVTTINNRAFYDCEVLGSVTIGDGVTTIGYRAFSDCEALGSVDMGDSVIVIGEEAFYFCSHLSSVTIPHSLTTIEKRAFGECESLDEVYYIGDETDRAAIQIGEDNRAISFLVWNYNPVVEQPSDIEDEDQVDEDADIVDDDQVGDDADIVDDDHADGEQVDEDNAESKDKDSDNKDEGNNFIVIIGIAVAVLAVSAVAFFLLKKKKSRVF